MPENQSQKTDCFMRLQASMTSACGRARFRRIWCAPWNGRPSCQPTPTSQPRGSQEVVSLDGKGKGAPSAPGKSPNTMVVRLIPASEAMNNALKSYRYCPLLEVRVAASSQS